MPFAFFVVPIQNAGEAAEDLNRFLRRYRALSVERRWVEQGPSSFWTFCVDYLDQPAGASQNGTGQGNRPAGAKPKVDYRELLPPDEFAVFAKLRELRKEISSADAVPVYTIFTNEQLAQMVQKRMISKSALETIPGIGTARIEKYGDRMLAILGSAWQP